jgi:hypothetical protein
MNLIEDRIRAAARAAAETVAPDSVPPLELPAVRRRRFGRGRRGARSPHATWSTWTPRLAPLAAALAVIAIVITVVTVSPPPRQGGPDLVTGAAGPDVPLGPPVSTYVRSGQVPSYFVTLTPSGAAVHLTLSGAAVATIRLSLAGGTVVAVTAAGDDRTFVLAEQGQDRKAVTFYQVRLGSSGRPSAPTRLPMSVADGKAMTGLALSPDGTKLAIAVAPGGGVQQVRLYPIHGGAKHNDPFAYDMLWSSASGQVLIGMIHSAGRDWVGVISGNRFTPLNVPSSLGTYAFGTW